VKESLTSFLLALKSHWHDEVGDRGWRATSMRWKSPGNAERLGIRVVLNDHAFQDDRAWFRFAFKWAGVKMGDAQSRAGMRSYRIVNDKLLSVAVNAAAGFGMHRLAPERWTSPPLNMTSAAETGVGHLHEAPVRVTRCFLGPCGDVMAQLKLRRFIVPSGAQGDPNGLGHGYCRRPVGNGVVV
jgi:hypothetical protein